MDRIFGVRLRLHRTWYLAFLLGIAIMVTQFPVAYPFWERVAAGLGADFLFLVAVSVREIALSILAISRGIPLKQVTLFVFGGVSQVSKIHTHPVIEVLLASAGLLCNMIIAGIFYGVHSLLVNSGSIFIDGIILWLAFMYFMLALFHFVPAFPLDGGRLLRVLLWKVTGDYDRAARIASRVGQGTGLLFIAGGILLLIFLQQWFNGLTLIFIGWVLQIAATLSRQQTLLREALQDVTARDIISGECPIISPELGLGQLVHDYILVTGQRYFVVADGAKLEGVVTVPNIKPIAKARWDSTPVSEVMTPASELKIAQAEQPATSLLEQMDEEGIDYLPVLEQDKVMGIVLRDSLRRLVRTRAELKQ